PGAVRFLSAVSGADYCKLLMALDCGSGDPDFHQLEPDGELAKPAPGASKSRIVKRAGVYESLPAEWATNSVASFATERRVRGDRGARHEVISWRSRRRTAHCSTTL